MVRGPADVHFKVNSWEITVTVMTRYYSKLRYIYGDAAYRHFGNMEIYVSPPVHGCERSARLADGLWGYSQHRWDIRVVLPNITLPGFVFKFSANGTSLILPEWQGYSLCTLLTMYASAMRLVELPLPMVYAGKAVISEWWYRGLIQSMPRAGFKHTKVKTTFQLKILVTLAFRLGPHFISIACVSPTLINQTSYIHEPSLANFLYGLERSPSPSLSPSKFRGAMFVV